MCLKLLAQEKPWGKKKRMSTSNDGPLLDIQHLHRITSINSLAALLRCCSKDRALPQGRLVHGHLVAHGYDRITFLANTLIDLYGQCGHPYNAQSVFNGISMPNAISWNLLISAFATAGDVDSAQAVFNKMPCPDSYSWNLLIKVYRDHGDLNEVRSLFACMPCQDTVAWTAIIAAFTQHGHYEDALDLFSRMQFKSVKADKLTYLRALDACLNLSAREDGQKIHSAVAEGQYDKDLVIGTALINMYGKCGSLFDARCVFSKMDEQDSISWTAMITVLIDNRHEKEALHLFKQMLAAGIKPDNISFICILDACIGFAMLQEGQEIHAAIVENGCEIDTKMGTSLVSFYGKCRSVHDARNVFSSIFPPNLVSWNALISAYIQNNCNKEVLDLFCQMQVDGMKPNEVTFIGMLDACADLSALKEGQSFHSSIVCMGYDHDTVVTNSVVKMYGKCRSLCNARSVFSSRKDHNVVDWNIILASCIWNGLGQECLNLFDQMQHEHVKPDVLTLSYAFDACATLAALEEGQRIHAISVEDGVLLDVMLSTSLIKMYGKCGSLQDATHAFSRMSDADVVSCTAMIDAYVENGHIMDALDLFSQMQLKGIEPDEMTVSFTLDACASLGALEEAQKIHNIVINWGYEKDELVEAGLINMYGKCGSLKDAKGIFDQKVHQTVVSWNALIGAFSYSGLSENALCIFSTMEWENVKPDGITFLSMLMACSHAGCTDDGKQCFASMKKYGIAYMEEHYVCIIDLVSRAGCLDEAEDLINSMPIENPTMAWSCLLGACRLHNDLRRAVQAAKECSKSDPNYVTPYVMLSNILAATCTMQIYTHL